MAKPWLSVMAAVALDGCAALIGGLVRERWLTEGRPALLGFASGVLLGTASLDLLPEALRQAPPRVVIGFAVGSLGVMAALQRMWGRRWKHAARGAGQLAVRLLAADAFHNAADGAAIAAGFLISPRLGAMTAVAVIVHEVPEELADYVLLRHAGLSRGGAIAALTVVQLTAGIGAAATLVWTTSWQRMSGAVLGIATGTFVYIALIDLLPDIWRTRELVGSRTRAAWGLIAGIALSVLEFFL